MDEPPLTRTEVRLTELSFDDSQDRFLTNLLKLADAGGGPAVGLLINGMVVTGNLSNPRQMADEVDRHGLRLVKGMERSGSADELENWDEIRQSLATNGTANVDAIEKADAKLQEDLRAADVQSPVDSETLPADLATRLIAMESRTHLTLTNAQIYAVGAPDVTRVAVMRVRLKQISGWWLINVDDEGNASFRLFAGEDVT